jgi:DNA polymerase-3 subunit alpha
MLTVLAARSGFSLGESILAADQIPALAKAAGQTAVALTDTMSVTGLVDFSKAAKDAGVKPIIGARLRISDDYTWRPDKALKQTKRHMPKEYFLTYYVRSEAGLKGLFRLLTTAGDATHSYYTSKLGWQDVLAEVSKLTAQDYALVLGDEMSIYQSRNFAAMIADILAMKIVAYAPIVIINTPYYGRINEISLDLHVRHGLPLLAVRPALYTAGDADAQEILAAICENGRAASGTFRSRFNRDLHPMNGVEFLTEAKACGLHLHQRTADAAGKYISAAIAETNNFANAVTYVWQKAEPSLPKLADDEYGAVVAECQKGFVDRLRKPMFGHQPTHQELAEKYLPRLKYELSVLKKLGFSPYFLTVQDIVRYAKENGIIVGPGRGSVGGSLVAYLMKITDIDPIRFGLLFERFINPERLDLPDADLDFMSERRHEIVEYMIKKYGADRVAGVSNFGTLGSASVLRDVSRVMGISESEYSCSKFVPKEHGQPVDLAKAREEVGEIEAFASKYASIWPIMERLEGSIRNMSQHAAGIVVAGAPLSEFAVVEQRKEDAVVHWDKRVIEQQGLVKIDLLGLTTLDVIKLTLDYMRESNGQKLEINQIPLDDASVLEAFSKGKTTGVFQFEGGGSKRMLRDMFASTSTPLSFEDVTAVSALNRPGPLEAGLDKIYIEGRGGNVSNAYPSRYVDQVLEETFGAIVYQEQVQKISVSLCGFTGAESDHLRKAIGKKDASIMKKMEAQFLSGAVAGYVEVELEDGSKMQVHRNRRFSVVGSDDKYTIEEVMKQNFQLNEPL